MPTAVEANAAQPTATVERGRIIADQASFPIRIYYSMRLLHFETQTLCPREWMSLVSQHRRATGQYWLPKFFFRYDMAEKRVLGFISGKKQSSALYTI